MSFLINKSFPIGNMAFIICIPKGFDPAPFWIKIFLSLFYLSKKFISNETFRRYKYHEVSRLIDNLCAIYHRNQFLTSSFIFILYSPNVPFIKQYTMYIFLWVYIIRTSSNSKTHPEN